MNFPDSILNPAQTSRPGEQMGRDKTHTPSPTQAYLCNHITETAGTTYYHSKTSCHSDIKTTTRYTKTLPIELVQAVNQMPKQHLTHSWRSGETTPTKIKHEQENANPKEIREELGH